MENEVRQTVMLGDVLILLAAIILVSFASFNIGRNLATDGTIKNQVLAGDFSNLEMETYNDKILSGRDVIEFIKNNDNMAILVNTAKMRVDYPLSFSKDLNVQFMNSRAYINYGILLSIGSGYEVQTVSSGESLKLLENTLMLKDGQVISEGFYIVDEEGMVVKNKDLTSCKDSGSVEYIDIYSKFDANLIRDTMGTVIGVCFTQIYS